MFRKTCRFLRKNWENKELVINVFLKFRNPVKIYRINSKNEPQERLKNFPKNGPKIFKNLNFGNLCHKFFDFWAFNIEKKTESLYCLKEVCYQKVKMYGLSRLDAAGLRWESGKRVQTLKIGFRLNRPNRKSHTGHKSQFRANFCRKARFKSKLVKKHREQYTL